MQNDPRSLELYTSLQELCFLIKSIIKYREVELITLKSQTHKKLPKQISSRHFPTKQLVNVKKKMGQRFHDDMYCDPDLSLITQNLAHLDWTQLAWDVSWTSSGLLRSHFISDVKADRLNWPTDPVSKEDVLVWPPLLSRDTHAGTQTASDQTLQDHGRPMIPLVVRHPQG